MLKSKEVEYAANLIATVQLATMVVLESVVPFAIIYKGYFYCHVPLELC